MHGGEGRRQAGVSLHLHAQQEEPNTPNRLEKKKYNPILRRHTLHREIK